MNRTFIDLLHALRCSKRSFSAVNLTLNELKTAANSNPHRTSQTSTIRSFSTTVDIKTGSKHSLLQDQFTSNLSPFVSNQQLSKRKQFKQITPDKHLVNYLDTHQLGYCAKRKVSHNLLLVIL